MLHQLCILVHVLLDVMDYYKLLYEKGKKAKRATSEILICATIFRCLTPLEFIRAGVLVLSSSLVATTF